MSTMAEIDWGTDSEGRSRLRCPEDPVKLAGQPLGMYHCPVCGAMQMAGLPHLPPEDYEDTYGGPWPAGYVEKHYADPGESPYIICPADDPAAVEAMINPDGWTVGDNWWASDPENSKLADGRWKLYLSPLEDYE